MTIVVCLSLFIVGLLLFLYSGLLLVQSNTAEKTMHLAQITAIDVQIFEVEKVSRFRWIEFGVEVAYQYEISGRRFSGNSLYLKGKESFVAKEKALQLKKVASSRRNVYVDKKDNSISAIFPDLSPSYKKHLLGLFGGGAVLMIVCIVLLVLMFDAANLTNL